MWRTNKDLRGRRARRRLGGFSLLEVLVALSILSFIVAGLYLSIGTSATHARRIGGRVEKQQSARLALERIATDLAGARWESKKDQLFFVGQQNQAEGGRRDRLEFSTVLYRWGGGPANSDDLAAVTYSLNAASGKGTLVREEKPIVAVDDGTTPVTVTSAVILEGVKEISFTYLDQQKVSHESWSTRADGGQKTLPAAVRVTLRLGEGNEEGESLSTLLLVPAGIELRPAISTEGSGQGAPASGTGG